MQRIYRLLGAEKNVQVFIGAEYQCTKRGQVGEFQAKNAFAFTRERATALSEQRRPLAGGALKKALQDARKLPRRERVADYRILRPANGRRYPKSHNVSYALETEPDAFTIVTFLDDNPRVSRPPRGKKRALLYVSHRSADQELRNEAWRTDLIRAEPGAAVFACDLRGIGESQPNTPSIG